MEIEIRSSNEAVVRGYVNAVERRSREIYAGGKKFVEIIKAGAFDRAIKKAASESRAINMLVDHNKKKIYASTNNRLKLREDNIGLYAEAVIRDENLIERAKNGDAKGWSFGFVSEKDSFANEETIDVRTIEELELREVSLIMDKCPCYIATSVEVRAEETIRIEERGYEDTVEVNVKNKPVQAVSNMAEVYKKKNEILRMI